MAGRQQAVADAGTGGEPTEIVGGFGVLGGVDARELVVVVDSRGTRHVVETQRAQRLVLLGQFRLGVPELVGTHRVKIQRWPSRGSTPVRVADAAYLVIVSGIGDPAHPREPVDPCCLPALGEFTGWTPRGVHGESNGWRIS